jgi:hypothetical protein
MSAYGSPSEEPVAEGPEREIVESKLSAEEVPTKATPQVMPITEKGKAFMLKEERQLGAVDSHVYHLYVLLAGGAFVYYVTILNLLFAQGIEF